MEAVLGTSYAVFFGLTVCIMGFAAYMTGQALANNWNSVHQVIGYVLLLGCADRFLAFALFEGVLLSPVAYLIDTAVLMAIALFAYRTTKARKLVSQYPWLYEADGLFSWREKRAGSD